MSIPNDYKEKCSDKNLLQAINIMRFGSTIVF